MKETFLVGRILLGGYLLYSGLHHFIDLASMSQYAAAKGVPMPAAAIVASGVLLLIAGFSFLLGLAPKVGIAAFVLFIVPVTLTMHQFWSEHGMARAQDMVQFTKNLGLLGAVLALAMVPEPWPLGVEARRRLFRWRVARV
jgi:putative oxidoreductase